MSEAALPIMTALTSMPMMAAARRTREGAIAAPESQMEEPLEQLYNAAFAWQAGRWSTRKVGNWSESIVGQHPMLSRHLLFSSIAVQTAA